MKLFQFILMFLLVSLPAPSLWAGGAVAAVKQRQLMEQQAYQQALQEEIIRRQQQEMIQQYTAAYQQAAVAQYMEAQQRAAIMAAAQEQMVAQYMAQQMAQEMALYQQAVIRREQVLAQEQVLRIKVVQNAQFQQLLMERQVRDYVQQVATAQVVAAHQEQRIADYQEALLQKAVSDKVMYEHAQGVRGVQAAQEARQIMAYQGALAMRERDQNKLYEDVPPSYVKDVVSVSDLWKSLDESAKAWPLMIDKKAKGVTIKHYIDELAKQGGKITKDPLYYTQIINDMSAQNPQMLDQPFMDVLRIVAIIEYDYDNGTDKDTMARKIFPDDRSFQANKKRVGK